MKLPTKTKRLTTTGTRNLEQPRTQNVLEANKTHLSPKPRLLHDHWCQSHQLQCRALVYPAVSFLPKQQASNHTRESKLFRRIFAAAFRACIHHSASRDSICDVRPTRPTCLRTRNQVPRLCTQSVNRWSRVSTSCAYSAQSSLSLKPWRCS